MAPGATTGAGALLLTGGADDGAGDDDTGGGTITAELAGALEETGEDTGAEAGAEVVVTGAAVTRKLAMPEVLDFCPDTRRRWVPAGVVTGTTKSILTIPSASARTAASAVVSSRTETTSPLVKPANSTSCDPPALIDADRIVLGATVDGTTAIVLVTTCWEVTADDVVGVVEDDAGVEELGVEGVVAAAT